MTEPVAWALDNGVWLAVPYPGALPAGSREVVEQLLAANSTAGWRAVPLYPADEHPPNERAAIILGRLDAALRADPAFRAFLAACSRQTIDAILAVQKFTGE